MFLAPLAASPEQRQRRRQVPRRRPPRAPGQAAPRAGWGLPAGEVRQQRWVQTAPPAAPHAALPHHVPSPVPATRLRRHAAAAVLAKRAAPAAQPQPGQALAPQQRPGQAAPRPLGCCWRRALPRARRLGAQASHRAGQPPCRPAQRSAVRAEVSTSRDSRLLRNPPASLKSEGTAGSEGAGIDGHCVHRGGGCLWVSARAAAMQQATWPAGNCQRKEAASGRRQAAALLTRDAARQLALVHGHKLAAQLAGVDLAGAGDAARCVRHHLLPLREGRARRQAAGWW